MQLGKQFVKQLAEMIIQHDESFNTRLQKKDKQRIWLIDLKKNVLQEE